MNITNEKPEKLKTYTIQQIESFDLILKKTTHAGKFYRKENILYVFEELKNNQPDRFLLKAIFID